jgi:hypothetical protein
MHRKPTDIESPERVLPSDIAYEVTVRIKAGDGQGVNTVEKKLLIPFIKIDKRNLLKSVLLKKTLINFEELKKKKELEVPEKQAPLKVEAQPISLKTPQKAKS